MLVHVVEAVLHSLLLVQYLLRVLPVHVYWSQVYLIISWQEGVIVSGSMRALCISDFVLSFVILLYLLLPPLNHCLYPLLGSLVLIHQVLLVPYLFSSHAPLVLPIAHIDP